jgi:hypothetical protein
VECSQQYLVAEIEPIMKIQDAVESDGPKGNLNRPGNAGGVLI